MTDTPEKTAIEEVLGLLDLEAIEVNIFRGLSPKDRMQRVFGGQVLGQALVAASRTVEARVCHSLHAYFLRAGDPKTPILYEVDQSRDGGSFTSRRVVAIQHGKQIFTLAASFQTPEDGFEHQSAMPDAPDPESLPTEQELRAKIIDQLPEQARVWFLRPRPIEMRPVEPVNFLKPEKRPPNQMVWFRATGRLPDNHALHQCVLAYASDTTLLDTALRPHRISWFDNSVQMASLDHAMWFHRPFRADEWLLYVQDSPSASGARGFNRGEIYKRDGTLVASVTQEGLMRKRTKA
ncbi:MAG TPA: acyl-CoA thioesterase II [Rhizomicrobium sp.]|jgi:acyl-CoA thioesterase-2|nr:acyl-CoA thioesterase II [Rhizomicrobium sp.]